jgi:hypothetical protein
MDLARIFPEPALLRREVFQGADGVMFEAHLFEQAQRFQKIFLSRHGSSLALE